jgi:hypothetical protein
MSKQCIADATRESKKIAGAEIPLQRRRSTFNILTVNDPSL